MKCATSKTHLKSRHSWQSKVVEHKISFKENMTLHVQIHSKFLSLTGRTRYKSLKKLFTEQSNNQLLKISVKAQSKLRCFIIIIIFSQDNLHDAFYMVRQLKSVSLSCFLLGVTFRYIQMKITLK